MAQLVEHPALDSGSGYDPRVMRLSPALGSAWSLLGILPPSLSLPLPLSPPLPLPHSVFKKKSYKYNYPILHISKLRLLELSDLSKIIKLVKGKVQF